MDVAAWLKDLGLGKYAPVFADNEIDAAILPDLTDEDLRELGLPLGPRKTILKAISSRDLPPTDIPAAEPAPKTAAPPAAERRQLTVMFVDLVGSTELSARLDPEEMGQVIRHYQNAVAGEIARFDGHVAKFMGDGVLAYFGWPRAHENEPERALRAGLSALEAITALKAPDGSSLAVRIGIATGLVVVGDMIGEGSAREETAIGETLNLASRLQGLAEPGRIVVAQTTRDLLGGLFDFESLGRRALKGIADPTATYAVMGEKTVESRFSAQRAGKLTPIIGRDQELGLLLEHWGQARAGDGQMILLTGEAGIGKSRLTEALVGAVKAGDHVTIRYQCSPYHTDSALYPTIQQLNMAAGFTPSDNTQTRLDKLEALIGMGTTDRAAQAALLAPLLGLDGESRYGPLGLSPQQQRTRTLRALVDQLTGLARSRPVLWVLEDAHWVDPTTLELVELALDPIARAPVLILATARPTFEHGFGGHPVVTRLMLNRLGRAQVAAIATRVSGGKPLPDAVLDEISARTDGVPLFVEEIAKTVLESGILREEADAYVLDGPLSALMIPATLHDSLMARLDRLRPVKEVAQMAAVIGRSFDHRTLAEITPLDEGALAEALDRLVEAELVFRRGSPPDADYLFKHALVRDAAYESLLKSRRQAIHADLLATLERHADTAPELLAHHAQEAGETDKAINYWTRAGTDAFARPAYPEAVSHFESAMRLLPSVADDDTRRRRELDLRLKIYHANMPWRGYAHPVSTKGIIEARSLVDEIETSELRFPIYYGNWLTHHVRAEHDRALQLATEIHREAADGNDPGHRFIAARLVAMSQLMTGAYEDAERSFEEAMRFYDPALDRELTWQYGQSQRVGQACYRAMGLAGMGFSDRAWREITPAVEMAEDLGHANSQAYAHLHVGLVALILRDENTAECAARRAVDMSSEHHMDMWLSVAMYTLAATLARTGRRNEAADIARQAQVVAEKSGIRLYMGLYRAHHLVNLVALGCSDEARDVRRGVLGLLEHGTETWTHAEVLRLLAAADLQRSGDATAAEQRLRDAIGMAHRQHALLWELHAAHDLARLLRDQGRNDEARAVLEPVYASFTEGFARPALIEAKAMLAQLH